MSFNRINIIDINYRKNEYAETVKKILLEKSPNKVKNKIYRFFAENRNDDILDIIKLAEKMTSTKNILFLIFGLEDVIGFSDYTEPTSSNNFGKKIFTIISAKENSIYLNNKRSITLFNKLKPFFYVKDKMEDFKWLDANKKLKPQGLFIGKDIEFSSIEVQWLKEKYKRILIDRNFFTSDIFDVNGFDIIEFKSNKEVYYNGII